MIESIMRIGISDKCIGKVFFLKLQNHGNWGRGGSRVEGGGSITRSVRYDKDTRLQPLAISVPEAA